jgi:hypothetical protein
VKRNRTFFGIQCLEARIKRQRDGYRRQELEKELAVHRKRVEAARLEVARVPRAPTNLDIAEITGIPKGSIDSTLFHLRRLAARRGLR